MLKYSSLETLKVLLTRWVNIILFTYHMFNTTREYYMIYQNSGNDVTYFLS